MAGVGANVWVAARRPLRERRAAVAGLAGGLAAGLLAGGLVGGCWTRSAILGRIPRRNPDVATILAAEAQPGEPDALDRAAAVASAVLGFERAFRQERPWAAGHLATVDVRWPGDLTLTIRLRESFLGLDEIDQARVKSEVTAAWGATRMVRDLGWPAEPEWRDPL